MVRAEMDQVLTTTNADGAKETSYPYWEHNVLEINVPVTIGPPA